MSLYEQNLQALFQQNPRLATRLFGIGGNEKFEVFVDKEDALNVNVIAKEGYVALHPGRSVDEVVHKFTAFEEAYARYPYLYMYGIGTGVLYKLLLQNPLHKRVLIIEPELELIFIALHFNDFQAEILEGRLWILWEAEQSFADFVEFFSHKEALIFAKIYHLEVYNDFYAGHYAEGMLRTNYLLTRAIEHAVYGIGNDSKDALIGLEHHVANAARMVETPTVQELLSKIKNTPTAVIVSTGPSLGKQLTLLREIAPYVTIFCVDASFPILEKAGIKPDLVFSIERVIETAKFYKETSADFQEDVVFCITSIAHPMLFDYIKAGTLQISMRPFGYTHYFDLGEYGYLGIGMSAANMAFEAIYHAKFEHCILIGQDLSYGPQGETHSDGHLYGTSETKRKKTLHVTAYGGEGTVETTEIWNLFKNFFESDIRYALHQGMRVINATEGGARIEGAEEMTFVQAVALCVSRERPKERIVLAKPDPQIVAQKKEQVARKREAMLTYAQSMQQQVQRLFEKVAQRVEGLGTPESLSARELDAIAAIMEEIDAVKAHFDDQEFVDVFIDATQAMIIHQELELAKLQVRPVQSDDDKRLKMVEWIRAHVSWLFRLAGMMKAVCVGVERQGAMSGLVHSASYENGCIRGYCFDLHAVDRIYEIEIMIDEEPVGVVKADLSGKTLLLEDGQQHNLFYEIPCRFLDGNLHRIQLKERLHGIVLSGMPVVEPLLPNDRIYGDVVCSHGAYFQGWCKESGSLKPQIVEVWIDEMLVETIEANQPTRMLWHQERFGEDRFGFEYLVPKTLFDGKKHQIKLIHAKTTRLLGEEVGELVFGPSEFQHYRFYTFLKGLESVQIQGVSEIYTPGVVGFLVDDIQMKDEQFKRYLLHLSDLHINVSFIGFLVKPEMELKAKEYFSVLGEKIEFLKPDSIGEIAEKIEIYIDCIDSHDTYLKKVSSVVRESYQNIFLCQYTPRFQTAAISAADSATNKFAEYIFEHANELGFSSAHIAMARGNSHRLLYSKIIELLKLNHSIEDDDTLFSLKCCFDIDMALKYDEFKRYFFWLRKDVLRLHNRYLSGDKR